MRIVVNVVLASTLAGFRGAVVEVGNGVEVRNGSVGAPEPGQP